MKIRVIVTGATGMVGEGVLKECLLHPVVESVLVLNRRPCGVTHPKLTEIIHPDFYDISPLKESLEGYDACFFCLGISSVGKSKDEYYSVTYDLTMHVARTLAGINSNMTFCYISGAGTDVNGRMNWARVKGKTEIDLMRLPFKKVYAFRPGFLQPSKDLKNVHKYYFLFTSLFPVLRPLMRNYMSTLEELGLAMINTVTKGYERHILEVKDIVELAKR